MGRKLAARRGDKTVAEDDIVLPEPFAGWFRARGWSPRPHQLALLDAARRRRSTLLIAPTGAGKTLAGFLPSLVSAVESRQLERKGAGLKTLYISPLKALAVDIARNLTEPVSEMGLGVSIETRTGDTPQSKRARQRSRPPEILLTTPEQVALLISGEDAPYLFADLERVVLDELHALVPSKRGDLLALGLARLRALAPRLVLTGLSATVARPSELRAWLEPQQTPETAIALADLIELKGGAKPDVTILETEDPLPWASHTARYAVREVLTAIEQHKLTIVFVNTRLQAELMFHELWRQNEASLPIGLHHGSLDVGQRRRVEAAMAAGSLRAVVATSTLDLGLDWGDVDLVIHIGAPKGASRLIQRIGRSNHRLDEPSKAILVPANRFEVLECRAALEAAEAGAQDAVVNRQGGLDVLAQHVLGVACAAPFEAERLFEEVRSAAPYAALSREDFDRVIDLAATGGYALRAYDRFARLKQTDDGRWRIAHPRVAQQYRLNVGTIVESPMVKVRLVGRRGGGAGRAGKPLVGGRVLGEIDEYFAGELKPGDAFVLGGETLRLEGFRDNEVFVSRAYASDPIVPSYPGGRFPLSTHLAKRVREMLADPAHWRSLPGPVAHWLRLQEEHSVVPGPGEVLVETFSRGGRHHLVAYPFEGRLAHQTLGMLLTRRLERAGAKPLGFLANDYAMSVWGLGDLSAMIRDGRLDLARLFDEDMLGDDLDAWLAETSLMRRTFRHCAMIAGLIERRHPGKEKSGRQLTVSASLIYDVLRRYEPNHILLEAAWRDAATGLLDIARLGEFLRRIKGHVRHVALDHVSPLSVPILLEMGREAVSGDAREAAVREAAEQLIAEAAGEREPTAAVMDADEGTGAGWRKREQGVARGGGRRMRASKRG
ncbi:MAG: ligase-associated DNA damage response DEXH box helicase [Proteobacteria bacterium]|nr:ligase-associated DNA damage response DEXH box helicase [Pseudomonadota bacterium]